MRGLGIDQIALLGLAATGWTGHHGDDVNSRAYPGAMTLDAAAMLGLYDEQLRLAPEFAGATNVTRLGPLHLVEYTESRGVVTYRDLDGANAVEIRRLVADAKAFFEAKEKITNVRWKPRAHDVAPGLYEALVAEGFEPEDTRAIMVGEAKSLIIDEELPEGVRLRQIAEEEDLYAYGVMVDKAYGLNRAEQYAQRLSGLIAGDMGVEIWAAESDGKIIGGGRLDPVPSTDFSGLWGGGMLQEWRGQGIYRALTSVRARSALAMGKTLIQCDCSVYSRPILEKSGLVKISETTPHLWQRP